MISLRVDAILDLFRGSSLPRRAITAEPILADDLLLERRVCQGWCLCVCTCCFVVWGGLVLCVGNVCEMCVCIHTVLCTRSPFLLGKKPIHEQGKTNPSGVTSPIYSPQRDGHAGRG